MKNRLEYILFLTLGKIFSLLGLNLSRKSAYILAAVFFYIIPIRKKTTIENLRFAFPEKSKKEIKKIAFESYLNFATVLAENFVIKNYTTDKIKSLLKVENANVLDSAIEKDRGLILLSAHFGNWELGAISFALNTKKQFNIIVKSQRNPLVNKWMNDLRTNWGNKVVPLGASIRNILLELKNKNIVALVADQRGPSDGMRINFFGREAVVYPGPAQLSIKSNIPIIYVLTLRRKDFSYKAIIKEISTENLPENNEDKVLEISKRHTQFLEEIIRKYPGQWLWMHKRWKY